MNLCEIFNFFCGGNAVKRGYIAYILKILAALKMETARMSKSSALDSTSTSCHYPKIA
jgi:hypothetical protein